MFGRTSRVLRGISKKGMDLRQEKDGLRVNANGVGGSQLTIIKVLVLQEVWFHQMEIVKTARSHSH